MDNTIDLRWKQLIFSQSNTEQPSEFTGSQQTVKDFKLWSLTPEQEEEKTHTISQHDGG